MAHPTARARQRTIALDQLRESCTRLAERFGLDAPEIPVRFPKDPSHLPTLQLEAVTRFIDRIGGEPDDDPGTSDLESAAAESSIDPELDQPVDAPSRRKPGRPRKEQGPVPISA